MNVLLIHPPAEEDLLFKKIVGLTPQPIGLAYVAAAIEEKGHKADILDIPAENVSKKDYIRKLNDFNPDVVGIYLATYRHKKGIKILNTTKKYSNEITTVCGGPHSSVTAESVAKNKSVDYVISGEAELTFPKLLKAIKNETSKYDIGGLVFEKEKEIVTTDPPEKIKNLDKLPRPARHLLDMDRYTIMNHLSIASIVSSRGCPSDCNYCCVPSIFGTKCRLRSPKDLVDEMVEVDERYNPDLVMFMDENFNYSIDRIWEICRLLEEKDRDITWGCCSSGINRNHPQLLKAMAKNGCKIFSYTLETGSNKSLEVMDNDLTLERTKEDLKLAKKHGMIRILNIIMGMPGEGKEDIKESIRFAKEVNTEFPLFFLPTPYPGTKFYETAKRQGMIDEIDWEKYTSYNPVVKNQSITQDEIKKFLRKAYKECYLNKSSILNRCKMVINKIKDGTINISDLGPLIFQSLKSTNYIRKL